MLFGRETLWHGPKTFLLIAWHRPLISIVNSSSIEASREVLNGLDSQDREIIVSMGHTIRDLKASTNNPNAKRLKLCSHYETSPDSTQAKALFNNKKTNPSSTQAK